MCINLHNSVLMQAKTFFYVLVVVVVVVVVVVAVYFLSSSGRVSFSGRTLLHGVSK
jgi:hypothetical protein